MSYTFFLRFLFTISKLLIIFLSFSVLFDSREPGIGYGEEEGGRRIVKLGLLEKLLDKLLDYTPDKYAHNLYTYMCLFMHLMLCVRVKLGLLEKRRYSIISLRSMHTLARARTHTDFLCA